MRGRIGSLSACVALVLVALVAAAPAAGAKWSASDVEAGRNLLKQVPDEIRAGCRFTDVRGEVADPTLIAAVDCDLPGDAPADTLSYQWYETMEDADAAYDAVVSQEESPLQSDGCGAYEGEYTIDDEDGGRYTCMGIGSATSIVYTYEPFPVVGVITDVSPPGDVEAMGEFFDNDAGPIEDPGTIPSLQSQKFGSKAAKALEQHIPKAIRKHCEPNGDSFTSPWVAFEIQCVNPSPGVAFVKYTSYRDDEGFDAAYDEDRFLSVHDYEAPDSCDAGTWSIRKKTVGSYTCALGTGDEDGEGATYLIWTVDQDRIVAVAYANDSDMSTDDFIQWWNDDAGPLF
jgi:hypothetical protein